jgi:hypothetical protein
MNTVWLRAEAAKRFENLENVCAATVKRFENLENVKENLENLKEIVRETLIVTEQTYRALDTSQQLQVKILLWLALGLVFGLSMLWYASR